MSERQKLELSFSGLAAGALATITATVLASFFGSYGTLIGAGVSSVVSTAGAAIYQHFFRRTGSKLKEAGKYLNTPVLRSTRVFERGAATVTTPDPRRPGERRSESKSEVPTQRARSARPRTLADVMGETRGATTARIGDQESGGKPEPAEARGTEAAKANRGAFGEQPENDRTDRAGAFGEAGETTGGTGGDTGEGASGTRVMGAAEEPGDGPGGTGTEEASGESNLADTDDAETMAINRMGGVSQVYTISGVPPKRPALGVMLTWARGRWPKLLAGAVAVFIVVMGVVTVIEAIMDKPLSAAVRGEKSHGLTLTGGTPATNPPTNGPEQTGSPNPTEQPTEQNPGDTAPTTPNPQQTAQSPGPQTNVPQQPTTQPSTVPTQPPVSPDEGRLGPDTGDSTQGQNQSPAGQ